MSNFRRTSVSSGMVLAVLLSGCATVAPPTFAPAVRYPAARVTTPNVNSTGTTTLSPPAGSGVIRGQTPTSPGVQFTQYTPPNSATAGSDEYLRFPMQASGEPVIRGQDAQGYYQGAPYANASPVETFVQEPLPAPAQPFPGVLPPGSDAPWIQPPPPLPPAVDVDVFVDETRTGRFMFGVGVNSNLGVTGQITIDERNFDWRKPPHSWQDVIDGTAWRGAGQGFRVEAMPGNRVQRYLVSYTQPYLYLGSVPTPFSLNLSGFYFQRNYFDWSEQRLGGRAALGYRVTPDLSLTAALRAENITIYDPRVVGLVPELDAVVGGSDLFSGRLQLTHDTRDTPFAATEGHLFQLSYEQVFGSFDYPRGELEYSQHFLVRERPDGSGRHTLSYNWQVGLSGAQTPIFENYFAGGFSTLRGFDFRGASPVGPAGVALGGRFQFLGSVEYMFPLTADDMVKGVVFCDYGTVEQDVEFDGDSYRVSPGIGLRIAIPAMGPAPLALDLAVPIAHSDTDNIQNFSFFFGFGR